jgi:hypothetical protein
VFAFGCTASLLWPQSSAQAQCVTNSQTLNLNGSGNVNGIVIGPGCIINLGSVSTTSTGGGGDAETLFVNGSGSINNSGTATATGGAGGGDAYAAFINGSGSINNSGTATATGGAGGGDAYAAFINGSGSIGNSGTATATGGSGGGDAYAVFINGSGSIVNAGTATATGGSGGGDAYALGVNGSGSIVNAGKATATANGGGTAYAIFINGTSTLTLLQGSFIIGGINIGGPATVNMDVGNQNLTFINSLAGATVTGTVPFVVSGNRIASVDPTPFAVAGAVLTDFTRTVSSTIPGFDGGGSTAMGATGPMAFASPDTASRIDEAFASIPGLSAYASDTPVFKNPTVIYSDGTTIWARGFAGQRIQQADGVLLHNESDYLGGVLGADKRVLPDLRLGAFIGIGDIRTNIDPNFDSAKSDLTFGGAYARYIWGNSFLNAAVQGGGSSNSIARNINNNLLPTGLETATASYSGWYISPELTYGQHLALGHVLDADHTLTPSVQVRYLYGSFGGYTETGSTADLTVGTQTAQNLEERGELKLTRTTQYSPTSALLINLAAGLLGDERVGGTAINAILLGQALPFALPGPNNIWGGYGDMGFEFRVDRVTVFSSVEYLAMSDKSSLVTGKGGIRVSF